MYASTTLSCSIDIIAFERNIEILIRLQIVHVLAVSWYYVLEKLCSTLRDDIYSEIHEEIPTRCNSISKFYYSLLIWSSTCFGRHTAHHQEPKPALAATGFSYVEGCWTLSGTVCAWQRPTTTSPTTFYVWKTRGCQCGCRLLMMGGVSPETCWASYN